MNRSVKYIARLFALCMFGWILGSMLGGFIGSLLGGSMGALYGTGLGTIMGILWGIKGANAMRHVD